MPWLKTKSAMSGLVIAGMMLLMYHAGKARIEHQQRDRELVLARVCDQVQLITLYSYISAQNFGVEPARLIIKDIHEDAVHAMDYINIGLDHSEHGLTGTHVMLEADLLCNKQLQDESSALWKVGE